MYKNRDVSWLEFNYRVLREAASDDVPLFDRIKFLAIFSSNMDEFFSIRYPVILAISNLKPKTQKKIDKEAPAHLLENIQNEIERQFNEFGDILTQQILPLLIANNIVLYYNQPLREEHIPEVREIFLSRVLTFLQPIILNPDVSKKFEPEANKLYLIIALKKQDTGIIDHAIIKIPSDDLKRFFTLSPLDGKNYLIFIDDVIRQNAAYIFPGFSIAGIYSVKFNRNEDLDFEEDYHGDILKLVEKKLLKRGHGLPTRFLFESIMPRNILLYVADTFNVTFDEWFSGGQYHNLVDLRQLPSFGKNLLYEEWAPLSLPGLTYTGDIFREIERSDILLHFPYQSYDPVLIFFNQAATDPGVTEIYITLYRIAANSLIANALISAAKNGKKVVVFIELKARFDEANNISWGKKMKSAGAELIYSIPGIKVHTKIALVVKKERDLKKTYSIISTGNFNETTAKIYADHTLFTADARINRELQDLFNFLVKRKKPAAGEQLVFHKLLVSQFNMRTAFEALIEAEVHKVAAGGMGVIRIKINNLEEQQMIDLLYAASQAGVQIKLLVRGICCLEPQVVGVSEHIYAKRLVDRYLEHTRLFIFGEGEEARIYIGSSDWMTRNIYHRIEVCAGVHNTECRKELVDYFEIQWNDNQKNQSVNSVAERVPGEETYNAQRSIYNYLKQLQ